MRFPSQLKERGQVWKDFESSSLDLAGWFCSTDEVSDQAVTWALPVTKDLELLNYCCSSYMLCTFKGFAALPLFLMPTSLSCKPLTAHLEQQMHSKARIGPIIRWTSKIYMCHGQTEGRLPPCLGTVSILYDFPYCCICRRWTGHNISMMKHLVGSWDDHSLFKVFGPWHVCTCKSHATCSLPLVSPMLFTIFLCAWLASWWRLHMAHHAAFLRQCPMRTKCHGLSQPTMRKHYE